MCIYINIEYWPQYSFKKKWKSSVKKKWKIKILLLSADKESCTVILNKFGYINKVNIIFNEGITNWKFLKTGDTTNVDVKRFQDFLYRNFKDQKYYGDMHPVSK